MKSFKEFLEEGMSREDQQRHIENTREKYKDVKVPAKGETWKSRSDDTEVTIVKMYGPDVVYSEDGEERKMNLFNFNKNYKKV